MVFGRDTAMVKHLLKEKGFLKTKGKPNKSKTKKEICMKNVTNISIGSNNNLNEDDEFTIIIPTQLLNQDKSSPIKKRPVIPKTDKIISKHKSILQNTNNTYSNSVSNNSKNSRKFEIPNIKQTALPKNLEQKRSPSKSRIVKTHNITTTDDDDDDQFIIRIFPEQLLNVYSNSENVLNHYDESSCSSLSTQSWDNCQFTPSDTDKSYMTASSDDSIVSPVTDEDDDEEFTITIPSNVWQDLGHLIA